MCFRDIGCDMTVNLTEIFQSDHQQVRIITIFNAVNFFHTSKLPVPVLLLRISNSKPCSIFKSPFMF